MIYEQTYDDTEIELIGVFNHIMQDNSPADRTCSVNNTGIFKSFNASFSSPPLKSWIVEYSTVSNIILFSKQQILTYNNKRI